mmetsp:Transcript_4972/g.5758  ORF Transcript_4972/g.5758 Transcript_4972/m.5758 type:complete len:83 (-) Transcript_4972:767-1015(-)
MNSIGIESSSLTKDTIGKVAIFDTVSCYNPPSSRKKRDQSTLASTSWRTLKNDGKERFQDIRKKYSIVPFHGRAFDPKNFKR